MIIGLCCGGNLRSTIHITNSNEMSASQAQHRTIPKEEAMHVRSVKNEEYDECQRIKSYNTTKKTKPVNRREGTIVCHQISFSENVFDLNLFWLCVYFGLNYLINLR
eukprot:589340_1